MREEFLSIASHELKTPITNIKLQTQIALRGIRKGNQNVLEPARMQKFVENAKMRKLIENAENAEIRENALKMRETQKHGKFRKIRLT